LITVEALSKIQKKFQVKTNFFGPEMMLLAKCERLSMIQIPVNYKDRVGESSVTGNFKKAFVLGLQMIWLILSFRFTHNYFWIKTKKKVAKPVKNQ
jgi:hypothetical protein